MSQKITELKGQEARQKLCDVNERAEMTISESMCNWQTMDKGMTERRSMAMPVPKSDSRMSIYTQERPKPKPTTNPEKPKHEAEPEAETATAVPASDAESELPNQTADIIEQPSAMDISQKNVSMPAPRPMELPKSDDQPSPTTDKPKSTTTTTTHSLKLRRDKDLFSRSITWGGSSKWTSGKFRVKGSDEGIDGKKEKIFMSLKLVKICGKVVVRLSKCNWKEMCVSAKCGVLDKKLEIELGLFPFVWGSYVDVPLMDYAGFKKSTDHLKSIDASIEITVHRIK